MMMFKKKASLPARPARPSREEILEDITYARDDDIVFTSSPSNLSHSSSYKDRTKEDGFSSDSEDSDNFITANSDDISDSHKAYRKVKHFIEMHQQLEKSVQNLELQKQKLVELGQHLELEIQKVKEKLKSELNSLC